MNSDLYWSLYSAGIILVSPIEKGHILEGIGTRVDPKVGDVKKRVHILEGIGTHSSFPSDEPVLMTGLVQMTEPDERSGHELYYTRKNKWS